MIYTFGGCTLNTHLYTVQRAGQSIRLRPKVFQVLRYLLEHRERVVSKQELCEHVWAGVFISDATLESTLRAVRQALGDTGRTQRLIQTLPGYGYRFIAAVQERANAPAGTEREDGWELPDAMSMPAQDAPDVAPGPPPRGGQVDEPAPQEGPLLAGDSSHVGEWKVVTVLCCALTGAPPEREARYRQLHDLYILARDAVQGYGGTLQPVVGDQVLAVFGAPVAQEDHAHRAVLAALALQRRVREANIERKAQLGGLLAVRLGLHTGVMAVGGLEDALATAGAVVGDAVALHVQATPGMILCSEATARLVRGVVRVAAVGPVSEMGQPTSGLVYTVRARRGPSRSLVRREQRAWSPFVGRQRELATLHALLARVREGRGQVVGIMGEPGIGKSRSVYEFHRSLREHSVTYLACRCLSHTTTTPYQPIRELLRQTCGLLEGDAPEVATSKVRATLKEVGSAAESWTPYLLQVLGLPTAAEAFATLSPQAVRARTVDVLVQLALHSARRRPLVLEVENVHWIDPSSEEVIGALVARIMAARILLLLTYRPGRPPWIDRSYATQLALTALDPQDSRRVVQAISGTRSLPEGILETILVRAERHPLFLEELAHTVVEQADSSQPSGVPATLQAVLAARIDRLMPDVKRLLQVAAVSGKDIPVPLLQALVKMPEEVLQRTLYHLQAAELLCEMTSDATQTVTFKHVLIREAAYQSLFEETRQQVHRQIAHMLVERFPQTEETEPERLAHHYTEAGLPDQAIAYWKRAGQYALDRSAYTEAVAHFSRGLEVLTMLPKTTEHVQREIDLLALLGPALMATKGYAAPEVVETYARARELCQQMGETPSLFPVLRGLWGFYYVRAELQTAHALGEQLLRLAHALHDPLRLVVASYTVGATLFNRGEFLEARTHLERGTHGYASVTRHPDHTLSIDHGLACLLEISWALQLLGYPDQALRNSRDALRLAQEMAHPLSAAAALSRTAKLHQFRREPRAVQELAEALIALSTEQGFSFWLGLGREQRAWALVEQGQEEAGVKLFCEILAANRAAGREVALPYQLGLLAEAYGKIGQAEEGLRTVGEALAFMEKTGERFCEAELHRIKGELLLQGDRGQHPSEAETSFSRALEIARRQQAKWWELRAAMSLSQLWHRQGKCQAAHQLLMEIYGWFAEGFDTADLQEAKALLDSCT